MVENSFITCAITTSTDGSDDNHIHCFKAGQPCAAGKSRLEEETRKLHASGSTASLMEDLFASDEDSDEADNNEGCINKDDHEEEEEDDKEGNDKGDDEERCNEKGSDEEDDKRDDQEKDDKEEEDGCQEGKGDHQQGSSEDFQEDKVGSETGVGQLPISKRRKEGNQAAKKLMRVQRLRKVTKDINKGAPIDVDEMKPPKPAEMWIPELGLLKVDQECLMSPSGWLTDSIKIYFRWHIQPQDFSRMWADNELCHHSWRICANPTYRNWPLGHCINKWYGAPNCKGLRQSLHISWYNTAVPDCLHSGYKGSGDHPAVHGCVTAICDK